MMKKILLILAIITTVTTASDSYVCAVDKAIMLGARIVDKEVHTELDYGLFLSVSDKKINIIDEMDFSGDLKEVRMLSGFKYLKYLADDQDEVIIYWCKERSPA